MAAEGARNTGFEVQEYQVRVYFGNEHYWIEDQDTPIQYGEILSEILNFDAKAFADAVAYWQKCEDESDWENLNAARDAVYNEFEKLPFYNRCSRKPFREELETIKIDRGNGSSQWLIKRDTGDLKRWRQFANALSDLQYIQNRYAWFLDALLSNQEFEKKKGQKKLSLAGLLKSASLEGKVENAWLGGRRSAAIPRESIRYMFYETAQGPELVECLTFDRLLHFAYIELMRGIQKGNIPKRCANCGRWFLQTPGATYAYCNLIAPGETVKTCREIGAKASFEEKVSNNEIWQIHQRAYKKYYARVLKSKMSKQEFIAWADEASKLRDDALVRYTLVPKSKRESVIEELREKLNEQ